MRLQCRKEPAGPQERCAPEPWPGSGILNILTDLNEQFLELLIEQVLAGAPAGGALLPQLAELLTALDAGSRRRAAACPYLLVDAGFADPHRWRLAGAPGSSARESAHDPGFFTVPGVTRLAHQVFNNAWHMVRMEPVGATLFLGMPSGCAALLRSCSLRQLTALAEHRPSWLRPRWSDRIALWRELLEAALGSDAAALERARLHGVQLIAGELRREENPRCQAATAHLAAAGS